MAIANRKGQAALSDALYFLLIVSGLSALLFVFLTDYGNSVEKKLELEYRAEYATSALKTLSYSSTSRVKGTPLESSTEVDFLFATVKEDFADNERFDTVSELIVDSVVGLMEPVADSFDYMYYIYLYQPQKFAFFMIHASQFIESGSGTAIEIKSRESRVYLCNPPSIAKLDPLIGSVGAIYQATGKISLPRVGEEGYNGVATLSMWTATTIPEETLCPSNLNCTCFIARRPKRIGCDPTREECELEWVDCSNEKVCS